MIRRALAVAGGVYVSGVTLAVAALVALRDAFEAWPLDEDVDSRGDDVPPSATATTEVPVIRDHRDVAVHYFGLQVDPWNSDGPCGRDVELMQGSDERGVRVSDYGPGDRVRVTFEGVLDAQGCGGNDVGLRIGDGRRLWAASLACGDVEVLEKARPVFKAADVVLIVGNLGSPRHSLMCGTLAVIERAGGWDGDKSGHYVVSGYSTVAQAVIQQSVHARDLEPYPATP